MESASGLFRVVTPADELCASVYWCGELVVASTVGWCLISSFLNITWDRGAWNKHHIYLSFIFWKGVHPPQVLTPFLYMVIKCLILMTIFCYLWALRLSESIKQMGIRQIDSMIIQEFMLCDFLGWKHTVLHKGIKRVVKLTFIYNLIQIDTDSEYCDIHARQLARNQMEAGSRRISTTELLSMYLPS